MGCNISKEKFVDFDPSYKPSWKAQFAVLQFTPYEVSKLQKVFQTIQDQYKIGSVVAENSTKTVQIDALLEFIDLKAENTKFAQRIMSMFDIRCTGAMNFRDFVVSLWNYCTLSQNTLDLFAFDLYDSKENGFLCKDDIYQMLYDVYGDGVESNRLAKNVRVELSKMEEEGQLNPGNFKAFCKQHHQLLYPAWKIQRRIQKKVLGVSFWEAQASKRIKITKGTYISIKKFMEIHLDPELYDSFLRKMKAPASKKTMSTHQQAKFLAEETGIVHDRKALHDMNKESEDDGVEDIRTPSYV